MSLQDHVRNARIAAQSLDGLLNNFAAAARTAFAARMQAPQQSYSQILPTLQTRLDNASDALDQANLALLQEINAVKIASWNLQAVRSAADDIDFAAGGLARGINDIDTAVVSGSQYDLDNVLQDAKTDIVDIVRKMLVLGQAVGGVSGGKRRKTRRHGKKRKTRRRHVFA